MSTTSVDADVEELERQAMAAARDLASLLERTDLGEVEGAKQRARAAAKFWHLQALLLTRKNEHQEAARAANAAATNEELAIKAARSDLVTRVEELEQLVRKARTAGQSVRALAKQRKPAKPPGHDPRSEA